MIVKIVDMTEFVSHQRQYSMQGPFNDLQVAKETLFMPSSNDLAKKIGLDILDTSI